MDIRQELDNQARLIELEAKNLDNTYLINAIVRDYRVSYEEILEQRKKVYNLYKMAFDFRYGSCAFPKEEHYGEK